MVGLFLVTGVAIGGADADARFARALAPEFSGTARYVPTRAFLRAAEDSPNTGHGHHWFGNAESYLRVGDAMGQAMVGLLKS